MKISEKVYMNITYTFAEKIPTGLHNSLNPRKECLTGVDDDLLVHSGHYL
jgi:hypothetical protein